MAAAQAPWRPICPPNPPNRQCFEQAPEGPTARGQAYRRSGGAARHGAGQERHNHLTPDGTEAGVSCTGPGGIGTAHRRDAAGVFRRAPATFYQEPVSFTFTQVFIDPDKRGDATLDDAKAIKAALMAQADVTAYSGALGDGFMLQSYYPEYSQADIQKLFGSGFAESVADLVPGQWHGPVSASIGQIGCRVQ